MFYEKLSPLSFMVEKLSTMILSCLGLEWFGQNPLLKFSFTHQSTKGNIIWRYGYALSISRIIWFADASGNSQHQIYSGYHQIRTTCLREQNIIKVYEDYKLEL